MYSGRPRRLYPGHSPVALIWSFHDEAICFDRYQERRPIGATSRWRTLFTRERADWPTASSPVALPGFSLVLAREYRSYSLVPAGLLAMLIRSDIPRPLLSRWLSEGTYHLGRWRCAAGGRWCAAAHPVEPVGAARRRSLADDNRQDDSLVAAGLRRAVGQRWISEGTYRLMA